MPKKGESGKTKVAEKPTAKIEEKAKAVVDLKQKVERPNGKVEVKPVDDEGRLRLVFTAKITEHAERYDEMLEAVKKIAERNDELSVEERDLFYSAYKYLTSSRRASHRDLCTMAEREDRQGNKENAAIARELSLKVETEIKDICADVLQVLDKHLIPFATTPESKVNWNKMKGDYHRYLAELSADDGRIKAGEQAQAAYRAARAIAVKHLNKTSPTLLGLLLNFSVFSYEILQEEERACALAQEAFDGAMPEMDALSGEQYKESAELVQLLRDNLALWTSNP